MTAGPGKGEWEIIFDPPLSGPPSLTFKFLTKPTDEEVERYTSEARRLWENLITVTLPQGTSMSHLHISWWRIRFIILFLFLIYRFVVVDDVGDGNIVDYVCVIYMRQ